MVFVSGLDFNITIMHMTIHSAGFLESNHHAKARHLPIRTNSITEIEQQTF